MGREIVTKLVIKNSKVFEATGHLSRAGNTFFIEPVGEKECVLILIFFAVSGVYLLFLWVKSLITKIMKRGEK